MEQTFLTHHCTLASNPLWSSYQRGWTLMFPSVLPGTFSMLAKADGNLYLGGTVWEWDTRPAPWQPLPSSVTASSAVSPRTRCASSCKELPSLSAGALFQEKSKCRSVNAGKMYYCMLGQKNATPWGQAMGRGQSRSLAVAGLAGLGKCQCQLTALNLPSKAAIPDEVRCGEHKILFRKVYLV